jgi:Protein of unknown function (DUF3616)
MEHTHAPGFGDTRTDIQRCIVVAVAAFMLSVAPAAADVLAPKAVFQVNPQLSVDDDEATNVSGAACYMAEGVRKSCLLIGDEVRYARLFSIQGNTVVPGDKLFLLPERDATGAKFKETDAEGIAFADGTYYVVGSHGLNKKGKKQASRYFVYRIRVPQDTGRPSDLGDDKTASAQVERSSALERFIAAHPVLQAHALDVPGQQGVNVEGIAAMGSDLFFGFRGPVEQGAIILQASAKAVFDGDASPAQGHVVDLDGEGIRDLAAVDGGLLILSGPQERKPGKARVFFWKPGGERKLLADLGGPRTDDRQPEALLILSETSSAYTALVLSDGPPGGEPTLYEISKQ